MGAAFSMFLYAQIRQKNVEKGRRKSIEFDENSATKNVRKKYLKKAQKRAQKRALK